MKEFYHKWHSQYLNRDLEMLVFGTSGYPIILFPPEKGKFYDCKDAGLISTVENYLDNDKIKIYCPDTIDTESWYNFNVHPSERVKKHIIYEKLILNEVIQFAKYETERKMVGVAGCSFGAYHALNLAFRHPDVIDSVISMGGFFDIKQFIFGYYDDNCYFNNPFDYMPNLEDEWYLDKIKSMKIFLAVGEWDLAVQENKRMNEILSFKNIHHLFDIYPSSGHDWNLWKNIFPSYISKIIE